MDPSSDAIEPARLDLPDAAPSVVPDAGPHAPEVGSETTAASGEDRIVGDQTPPGDEWEPAPSEPSATPRVEAVVVAHEPGEAFEQTLMSLASQDYPRLGVRVLAAGGAERIRALVSEVLPDATVVDVDPRYGFGRTANAVLELESPPAFHLFCHDDVALAADTVRLLVEESLRSNAGILGPKLVHWDRPTELSEIGFDVDKLGHVSGRVDPGELDQEQHDAVVDVFAVSAAVVLVRSDLFSALGGFDSTMGITGEDVDLCWRAHVAGARVMVVPSAVVRHRVAMIERRGPDAIERVRERHRIRALLSNYGFWHTARVVPQAIVVSIVRALMALLTGRFRRAGLFVGAWAWNVRHPGSLLKRRRALKRMRQVGDADIRELQVSGYTPMSAFLRGQFAPEEQVGTVSARARDFVLSLREGPSRVSFEFWLAAVAVLVFGSRHLITRRVPVLGDLVPFDLSVSDQFRVYFDDWWSSGTGHEAAVPTAHGLVGVLGFVFFGSMGLLRTVLTAGAIPIGGFGVWRLLRPFDAPWIRVVGTAMYLANPLPYNALANGSWGALVLYAALPWVVAILARAGRMAPFGSMGGSAGPGVYAPSAVREILGLGLLVGLMIAVVPFAAVIVVGVAAVLLVGSMLAGWPVGGLRMLGALVGGLLVSGLLHLAWLTDVAMAEPGWQWLLGSRAVDHEPVSLAAAMRFDTGPVGTPIPAWGLLVAGFAPLALAREDRWAWAVRGWALYVAGVATVWLDGQPWFDVALPRPEVVLAPAALGLAVAVAMGVAAIVRDLRSYHFGWRQLVPFSAIVGIVVALVPMTTAAWAGDWRMPDTELNGPLTVGSDAVGGRVLWIGADDVLAAGGHRLDDDLTVAVTAARASSFGDRWAGVPEPGDVLVDQAVNLALGGETSRLGRMLAPMGITEIMVIEDLVPPPGTGLNVAVDDAVLAALSEQLDLEQIEVVPGITRFRNTAGFGVAAAVPANTTAGVTLGAYARSPVAIDGRSLAASAALPTEYRGPVDAAEEVYLAVPGDSRWRLEVAGSSASRSPALDWAVAFRPVADGEARVLHRSSAVHRVVMGLQLLLWGLAIVALVRLTATAREHRSVVAAKPRRRNR